MEDKNSKKDIPICKNCKKPMKYNSFSKDFECSNPMCYIKDLSISSLSNLNQEGVVFGDYIGLNKIDGVEDMLKKGIKFIKKR